MSLGALSLALAVALLVMLAWRAASRYGVERSVRARLAVGPDGIIPGAAPIDLRQPPPAGAVLLLHGFGDTPQTLTTLAHHLHARGLRVYAPLLPGHGRTLRDFRASRGAEWLAAARQALDLLRQDHERVGLVGLSMGGALAVLLAAEWADAPALVLLAPYLEPPAAVRWLARSAPLTGALAPYILSRSRASIHDPAARARSLAYGASTPRLIAELVRLADRARQALPQVRAPTLYVQSREDNRLLPAAAERAFAALGARTKHLEWLTGCGHVITVDYGRDRVAALTADWLREHMEQGRRAQNAAIGS